MFQRIREAIIPTSATSLARSFSRIGWLGLWIQILFGSLPALVLAYYLVFNRSENVTPSGIPFLEYLTIANLVILLFTIFWSYRYTRLGRQIADPALRPPLAAVAGTV